MVLKENRSSLELKFLNLVNEVLKTLSLDLYDLEWIDRSFELRIFIMDPLTKTAQLEDCVKVDRALTPYFESETWMPENVTLEVSSPGLYRHLNSVEHFKMTIGEDIMVTLNKKIDETQSSDLPKALRNNLKLKVKLIEADATDIVVSVRESKKELDEEVKFKLPYTQIKKANLETNINYDK